MLVSCVAFLGKETRKRNVRSSKGLLSNGLQIADLICYRFAKYEKA